MEDIQIQNPILNGNKYKVEFVSMTHDGKGVCKLDGTLKNGEEVTNYPVFVNNAIVGEKGLIELTETKKTLANGKLLKVFKEATSKHRTAPICPIYEECGGCHLLHMTYEGQLAFKRSMVKSTLQKIGGFKDVVVKPVIPSVNEYKYRNKVQIPFGYVNKKTVCGFYKHQSHEIIQLNECYIQSDEMTEITKFIRNLCNEFRISGYNEELHKGLLKHVLLRESTVNNEVMVVLVTLKKDVPSLQQFVEKLVKRHPKIKTVVQNINDQKTNVVLGKEFITLYGDGYITDTLLDHKFNISAESFYQVNKETCEVLYQKSIKLANLKPTDNVIDAYCGIGTITLSLSSYVEKVYGVEIVEQAVKNAKDNAKLNKIKNVSFVCNKAEDQIVKWKKQGLNIDTIFVDPPRKGLDMTLMDTISEMNIKKVIYISCDVATLARDLKYFQNLGYTFDYVQPVDMFPQTMHVETITLLCLKEPKK